MAKTHRHKEVHALAEQSLDLANQKVLDISKLVDDDRASDKTQKILRELSWLVYRVGEAIVDQLAATSSK